MLGEPALVPRHHGGDAQGVALLAQQRVPAVAGAVGPDLAALGEVRDVLGGVARPRHVRLALGQRRSERVHSTHEEAVGTEFVEDGLSHAGHGAHGDGDIGGVGDLDADRGEVRTERAHAERDDVHRPALHGAAEDALFSREDVPHLGGSLPVVGRARVLLLLGADERPVLDPGDIGRVGGGVVRVGALDRVELLEGALLDELLAEPLVLRFGSVTPDHAVRLGQFGDLVDPRDQFLVFGWDDGGSRDVARHDCSYDEGFCPSCPVGAATRMLHDGRSWRSSGADRTHLIIRRVRPYVQRASHTSDVRIATHQPLIDMFSVRHHRFTPGTRASATHERVATSGPSSRRTDT